VNTFYATHILLQPGEYDLGEDAAHHAKVKRLSVGDPVRTTNGAGIIRSGGIVSIGKKTLVVELGEIEQVSEPFPFHLYSPVADRDRMLWLAEKAAELQVASLTPVLFDRSKSVNPRGEGDAFRKKLVARTVAALEQSGGAWLTGIGETIDVEQLRVPLHASAYLLDRDGPPLARHPGIRGEVHLVIGPEGGLTPGEKEHLTSIGWNVASVAEATLRFETAAIAGAAIVRGFNLRERGERDG
jgi:16S rRNA (uracil1498-N3)-methyltransferase